MRKVLLLLTAMAAFLAVPLVAQQAAPTSHPQRIVAVGDLHGDFDAWQDIARAADLIDKKGRWAGGKTVLVQLGDVTDRGPDSLKIIRHLQSLQEEAASAGGEVIVLMGNHEAMNVIGDLRYVHPGEYEAFRDRRSKSRRAAAWQANREPIEAFYKQSDPELTPERIKEMWFAQTPLGMLEHRRAWRPGGELGEWAASLPAIAKVGDTLFVHGGLSEEATRETLEAVNQRYQAALAPGDEIDRTAVDNPLGPLWYRGNVYRENAPVEVEAEGEVATPQRISREEEIALVLERYGASRLVVGHTPSLAGIVADLSGRLIRADTGISSYYSGPASYVEIREGKVFTYQRNSDGSWTAHVLDSSGAAGAR